jgi:hypothetical protein
MREVVYAKFKQHKNLKEILLSTGDKVLIEHTSRDSYWGDGGDGSGQNWLGKTLVTVRDQLRNEASSPANTTSSSNNTATEPNSQPQESSTQEETEESNSDGSEEEEVPQNSGIRIIGAPTPTKSAKQISNKRKNARRKRNIYVDQDGSSKLEKSTEYGQINVVGESKPVSFSEKALPPSAKFVVHRNQYVKKRQGNPQDFEEFDEEDFPAIKPTYHKANLADFIPVTTKSTPQQEETPDYLLSPQQCIESAKATVELLKQLPEDDPMRSELVKKCQTLVGVMTEFLSQVEQEDIVAELLQQFESVSLFVPQ